MARIGSSRWDLVYRYDFTVDGGAVGAIPLRGDALRGGVLGTGLVVLDALLLVHVVPTSGGWATIRLDAEASGDVQAQAAISGAPWSTVGAKRVTLTATSAPVRLTADRTPNLQVGTAALTAGRVRLVLSVLEAV